LGRSFGGSGVAIIRETLVTRRGVGMGKPKKMVSQNLGLSLRRVMGLYMGKKKTYPKCPSRGLELKSGVSLGTLSC